MKYTIMGFSQAKMLEYNLDMTDITLLRWFSDFKASEGMSEITDESGNRFYWVSYKKCLSDLPVLGIKTTTGLYKRLTKMVESKILTHYCHKSNKGSFSCYNLTSVFIELQYDDDCTVTGVKTGSKLELRPKDSSIKEIKENIKRNLEDEENAEETPSFSLFNEDLSFEQKAANAMKSPQENKPKSGVAREDAVIDLFNERTGSKFRHTESNRSMVRARIREGYTDDEIDLVCRYKYKEWHGSDMERHLIIATIFSKKFDGYLQAALMDQKKNGGKHGQMKCPKCPAMVSKYAIGCEECGAWWDDFKSAGEE